MGIFQRLYAAHKSESLGLPIYACLDQAIHLKAAMSWKRVRGSYLVRF